MKNPISIESDIEFLIVGPIEKSDGILIKSNNLNIELIGIANNIYYENNNSIQKIIENYGVWYFWTEPITINFRKRKYLFCFKLIGNYYSNRNNILRSENSSVNRITRKLLSNFFSDTTIFFSEMLSINNLDNEDSISGWGNYISWKISPLLLYLKHQ